MGGRIIPKGGGFTRGRGGVAAMIRAAAGKGRWGAAAQPRVRPVAPPRPPPSAPAATADLAAGMVAALPEAGSSPTTAPTTTQIWGGTSAGAQALPAGSAAEISAVPSSNAATAEGLTNSGLLASPVGDTKKAGGGMTTVALAGAGFLVAGPLGAVAGLVAGAMLGKSKPKTGSEAQGGLAAAQAASVRAKEIDATEQNAKASTDQLQSFMGY